MGGLAGGGDGVAFSLTVACPNNSRLAASEITRRSQADCSGNARTAAYIGSVTRTPNILDASFSPGGISPCGLTGWYAYPLDISAGLMMVKR
jgi:hypothetical protein